jgi:hypothetical protein
MPATTSSRFLQSDTKKLIEAVVEGTVGWAMMGKEALVVLNNVPYYHSFGERFTVKQMTNTMVRLKKLATSPQDLKNETVEKMKLDNVLVEQFGK